MASRVMITVNVVTAAVLSVIGVWKLVLKSFQSCMLASWRISVRPHNPYQLFVLIPSSSVLSQEER